MATQTETCATCEALDRASCLCDQYVHSCTVVDETTGAILGTPCPSRQARLAPWVGAGHAVCLAHELDPRVHIIDSRGTTRIVIPAEEAGR